MLLSFPFYASSFLRLPPFFLSLLPLPLLPPPPRLTAVTLMYQFPKSWLIVDLGSLFLFLLLFFLLLFFSSSSSSSSHHLFRALSVIFCLFSYFPHLSSFSSPSSSDVFFAFLLSPSSSSLSSSSSSLSSSSSSSSLSLFGSKRLMSHFPTSEGVSE